MADLLSNHRRNETGYRAASALRTACCHGKGRLRQAGAVNGRPSITFPDSCGVRVSRGIRLRRSRRIQPEGASLELSVTQSLQKLTNLNMFCSY